MTAKIIIHNPTNFTTKKYRYYNIFFDKLVETLKEKFDIIENRYFIDSHKERHPIKLLYDEQNTNISHSTLMLECEMILENYDTKQLKVLSVSDYFTHANLGLFNNEVAQPYISKILLSQFNRKSIEHHCYNKVIDSVYSPWIYFPSNLYDLNELYNKRQKISSLIDKFYFRGSGLEHRPMIKHFNQQLFYGGGSIGNFENYANEAIQYKIGFSCAGSAQFCYRDIEYMAMGIPMLRFEYTNEMSPNLIPNFHYISITPPYDCLSEHTMTNEHAQIVENKFLEIKNDIEFLQFISNNAREYYLNFIHDINGIQNTLQILKIEEWL
jgi:hypothetical protein